MNNFYLINKETVTVKNMERGKKRVFFIVYK